MNVEFSPTIISSFLLEHLYDKELFNKIDELARRYKVPSLEAVSTISLSNIVRLKKPKNSIEIGSGVGMSTLAIVDGYKDTNLICLDGNLERYLIHTEYFKDYANIKNYQMRGEVFLQSTDMMFDFAFVDSVKREYPAIFNLLRKRLNKGAVVVFDDILIYGFIACEEAETPLKYRNNRLEILSFINELKDDKNISIQLIPVGGGLLVLVVD